MNEQPQPLGQTTPTTPPNPSLSPPQPQPQPTNPGSEPSPLSPTPPVNPDNKHKKLIIIGVIVAILVLLGLVGWMSSKDESGKTVQKTLDQKSTGDSDDTKEVKKVSFTVPPDLPASFVKSELNLQGLSTTLYNNEEIGCGLTSGSIPLGDQFGNTPKEVIVNSANMAEELGIKVTKSTDGPDYTFKDVNGTDSYKFQTLELEQSINNEGIGFDSQTIVFAYHQFGSKVGYLNYSCQGDAWEANRTMLEGYFKGFTVETER